MNRLLKIVWNDTRLIFRERTMFIIFFIPVVMVFIFRIGVPLLSRYVQEIEEFYWIIIAAFTAVTAATPAFLVGFIILDERDENIHFLQQILPLPKNFILKLRIAFMVFIAFIFSLILLTFNSLIYFKVSELIINSILFSLIPPILAFCIVAFSKNKIEATTFYKGLSMVLIIPLAAFFISSEWKLIFGILPFYWTYNSFHIEEIGLEYFLNFLAGIVVHVIYIWFLFKIYLKRIN